MWHLNGLTVRLQTVLKILTMTAKCHPVERLKSFVAKLHDKYKANLKEEVKQHIDKYLQGKHAETSTAANVDILIAINPEKLQGKLNLHLMIYHCAEQKTKKGGG